jgi:glycosyltransferase involved in cell wall biosynthesis
VRLTLVVPCYNEEKRLPVDAFRKFTLDGVQLDYLFVNDGSTDATARILESFRAENPSRISVLTLEKNSGKAEAVRRGMSAAMERSPDIAGFWDADLATPLNELPLFVDIFNRRPEIQMVFASRVRLLGRSIKRKRSRHYIGRFGSTLISQSLGVEMYDTQCGAKLYRVDDTLRDIFSTPFVSKWIFDAEIIARFVKRRGKEAAVNAMYELPIREWRDVHGSKVKSRDFLRALTDLWKIHRSQ